MRPLALPALKPASVLVDCIAGCSDQGLVIRLKAAQKSLIKCADQYDQLAKSKTLHLVPRVTAVGTVTKQELQDLYTDQMSATTGAARTYYNAIRNAPVNSKCPLCGVGTVTVLDHHLPKSKYPDLAVCPFNLVPACDFCNNAKKARFPKKEGEQTLHPYYDDFTTAQWIFANLDTGQPPALTYYVASPNSWATIEKERAQQHFKVVKLGLTFASNANDELITLREHLTKVDSQRGHLGVQAYLDDERIRHSVRLNSWQHAMYQCLAASSWFIGGGFLSIPN